MTLYAGGSTGLLATRHGGPIVAEMYYDSEGWLIVHLTNSNVIGYGDGMETAQSQVYNNIDPITGTFTDPATGTTVPPTPVIEAPTFAKEDFSIFSVVEFMGDKTTIAGYPQYITPTNGGRLFLVTMELVNNSTVVTLEENQNTYTIHLGAILFGKVCVKLTWEGSLLTVKAWGGGCASVESSIGAWQGTVSFEPSKIIPWG